MSGLLEDLQEQVSDLQSVIVRLCHKLGHEFDKSWRNCDRAAHGKLLSRELCNQQRSVCGAYKCEDGV